MNNILNYSKNIVSITDLNSVIDWDILNTKFNECKFSSNKFNYISDTKNLLDNFQLINTKNILENHCRNFLDNFYDLKEFYTDLKITTSWGNITNPGQSHHEHEHPFSVVSGVIFLDSHFENLNLTLQANVPDIPYYFAKDKVFVSLHSMLGLNEQALQQHSFLKNHLILFLSNTRHFVSEVSGSAPKRRTISFNTFWEGNTGDKINPLLSHTFKVS